MIQFSKPLDKIYLTQPFGVDYIGGDFYSKLGLKAHNGLDFVANNGDIAYAVYDGEVSKDGNAGSGYGLNARLFIDVGKQRLECVYGHLKNILKTGKVLRGEAIAECDNTGYSTGPHLHFGIRIQDATPGGWQVRDYKNGYFGYVDPATYFPKEMFLKPVELRYGQEETWEGRWAFRSNMLYFIRTQKRLPTPEEYNALRFGYWDLRTVLDPSMYTIWAYETKPSAKLKGLIK